MDCELSKLIEYDQTTGLFRWLNIGKRDARKARGWFAGTVRMDGYCVVSIGPIKHRAHRLAWRLMVGAWLPPDLVIDHINGNKQDNRWCNLRAATKSQNMANRGANSNNTSGKKGVHKLNRETPRPYTASIRIGGRAVHLGRFRTPEEAHAAYCVAAQKHFGEYARP